jgi:tetratricopeptide (TPR) repeat protein
LSDWNFPEALRYGDESIRADPKYELGHTWNAWLLGCCGWPDKSREQVEIGLTLAPSKSIIYRELGNVNFSARDFTNAIKWYQKAIDWEPHHFVPYNGIGRALQALGDYTNSLDYFQKYDVLCGQDEAKAKQAYSVLRRALDAGGIAGYWQKRWEWTETDTNIDAYTKAVIQIHLGRTNSALDWLEKSYKNRQHDDTIFQHPLVMILYDEYWDGIRDDPRFQGLLDKIGFSKVMPPYNR